MSDRELCTQYEFIVTMIESGSADKVVEILKNAIKRIDMIETSGGEKVSESFKRK